eukprot:511303_1
MSVIKSESTSSEYSPQIRFRKYANMSVIMQESTSSGYCPQDPTRTRTRTITHTESTVKSETNPVMNKPPQPSVSCFQCEYCESQFSLKGRFMRHVASSHEELNIKREP